MSRGKKKKRDRRTRPVTSYVDGCVGYNITEVVIKREKRDDTANKPQCLRRERFVMKKSQGIQTPREKKVKLHNPKINITGTPRKTPTREQHQKGIAKHLPPT